MRLSSHPNVLNCYTSFVMGTTLWLVTQFMSKGSSLACIQAFAKISKRNESERRITGGGMVENIITYILHQTLLGLKYIHDNGQIHRDIKAGNILLHGSGDGKFFL